jgi:hypothetical protein
MRKKYAKKNVTSQAKYVLFYVKAAQKLHRESSQKRGLSRDKNARKSLVFIPKLLDDILT